MRSKPERNLKQFGYSEAMAVWKYCLATSVSGMASCVARFEKVRNSVHYDI